MHIYIYTYRRTFDADQDRRVLHSDAGCRGSQGSAQSMIILETDPGLGYKGRNEASEDQTDSEPLELIGTHD